MRVLRLVVIGAVIHHVPTLQQRSSAAAKSSESP
jgi:hypothetical protein